MEVFHKNFLADDALYSHQFYHVEHIRDSDVSTTPWQKDPSKFHFSSTIPRIPHTQTEASEKIAQYRQIRFSHQIQTPVGMANAKGTKYQTLYEFPNNKGFILDCTIEMTGLQSVDCFYVDERWIIQPNSEYKDKENTTATNEISITTKFELRFIKKTWWKQIILNMTIAETKKWFENYASMVQDCLAGNQKITKQNAETLVVDNTTIRKKTVNDDRILYDLSAFSYVALFCLIISIFYIAFVCIPNHKQMIVKIASMEKEILRMKKHIENIEHKFESSINEKAQLCHVTQI